MNPQIRARFNNLKTMFFSHFAVRHVRVRGEELTATRGYVRLRLDLRSQDTVEIFVYLIEQSGSVSLKDYSLHWQHKDGTLVQRWDTAPHHPELADFPYHTHKANGAVEPTEAYTWESFLTLLEQTITTSL